MPVHNKLQAKTALTGGVIAGAAGGIALLVVMLLVNLIGGRDVVAGMKFPGAWLLRERAMEPGIDFLAIYVGLGSHFAVSIAWGAAFALLFYGLSRTLTVAAGLAWGIVVWLAMYYVVLPVVGLADATRSASLAMAVVQHLLFGAVVAVAFLPFQRELPRGFLRGQTRHA